MWQKTYVRVGALVIAVLLLGVVPVGAHCDALDGPVVKAARAALDRGDINLVLVWVQEPAEREVREAFAQTIAVRAMGGQAKELADRYFFETLVRLHRAGEGAAYTGLKPAGTDPGPAIRAADAAVESGSIEPVVKMVLTAAEKGLRDHFMKVVHTGHASAADVAAGRAHVGAYVVFIHYVERLYQDALAAAHGHAPETEKH